MPMIGGDPMNSVQKMRACRRDIAIGAAAMVAGIAISGMSLSAIAGQHRHLQMAQATQPLQSTPGAESRPSAPSTPADTTTGSRPSAIPPEPARPDADAVNAGAKPALPPAPAEKTAAPIGAK